MARARPLGLQRQEGILSVREGRLNAVCARMATRGKEKQFAKLLEAVDKFREGTDTDRVRAKEGWFCKNVNCEYAVQRKVNFHVRKECHGRGRQKSQAVNPPAAQRLPPQEPTARAPTVAKAKAASAKKAREAEAAAAAAEAAKAKKAVDEALKPGPIAAAFAQVHPTNEEEGNEKRVAASEELRLGLTQVKEVDIDKLYRMPPTVDEPSTSIQVLVGKTAPVEAAMAIAAKLAEVKVAKQMLACASQDHSLWSATTTALAEQEGALAKLQKRAPCPRLHVEQLKAAKQEQSAAAARWEQHATSGMENAPEKHNEQLALADKLMTQLQERRAALVEAYTKTEAAWREHHRKRREAWELNATRFDAKIRERGRRERSRRGQAAGGVRVDGRQRFAAARRLAGATNDCKKQPYNKYERTQPRPMRRWRRRSKRPRTPSKRKRRRNNALSWRCRRTRCRTTSPPSSAKSPTYQRRRSPCWKSGPTTTRFGARWTRSTGAKQPPGLRCP